MWVKHSRRASNVNSKAVVSGFIQFTSLPLLSWGHRKVIGHDRWESVTLGVFVVVARGWPWHLLFCLRSSKSEFGSRWNNCSLGADWKGVRKYCSVCNVLWRSCRDSSVLRFLLRVFQSVMDAYPRILMLRHDGKREGKKYPVFCLCLCVVLGTM
jgi:hypothetical protein